MDYSRADHGTHGTLIHGITTQTLPYRFDMCAGRLPASCTVRVRTGSQNDHFQDFSQVGHSSQTLPR